MRYDPEVHHRRSIRLKGYDYSRDGLYFVTICTWKRECFFLIYPALKEIVEKQWREIPNRYQNVFTDEFVIMPNHLHGIIGIGDPTRMAGVGGAGLAPAPATPDIQQSPIFNRKPTVGDIVGSFKSLCIHEWLQYIKANNIAALGKFWQRNYFERIIWDEAGLERTREYIRRNPERWKYR